MLKIFMPMLSSMSINSNYQIFLFSFNLMMMNLMLVNSKMHSISYFLMGDLISYWMTNLTLWMMTTIVLIKMNFKPFYKTMMKLILIVMFINFYNWSMLMFYIMFEMSLMLIVIFMLMWSYQPERLESVMFMVVMTTLFSLPFMFLILQETQSISFWFFFIKINMWKYLSIMFIFSMKMPIYFLHMWLPKAHTEAPVQGSMILAALMLKLGSYGLTRFCMIMNKMKLLKNSIMMLMMMMIFLLSMNCIIQMDMKMLIAYSSVVHMMISFITITLSKSMSMNSMLITSISHGLTSSLMFFMANMVYMKSKSRNFILNKGILSFSNTTKMFWFIACMMNLSMPPFLGIVSEMLSMKLLMDWHPYLNLIIVMLMFSSFLFTLFMFTQLSQTKKSKTVNKTNTSNLKKNLIINLHWMPNLISMKSSMIILN